MCPEQESAHEDDSDYPNRHFPSCCGEEFLAETPPILVLLGFGLRLRGIRTLLPVIGLFLVGIRLVITWRLRGFCRRSGIRARLARRIVLHLRAIVFRLCRLCPILRPS